MTKQPLPPPLPPETRTVGQLVAESIRFYGSRPLPSLALGLAVATINQVTAERDTPEQALILLAASPLMAAAYTGASALVGDVRPSPRVAARAVAAGTIIFLPVPVLMLFYILPAVAWLALFGLAVPAIVLEGLGLRAALGRGLQLARADYVHALGSLATLAILFGLVRLTLAVLLRDLGDSGERAALGLADLVVSPLLFLGAALLYFDQAARVGSGARAERSR